MKKSSKTLALILSVTLSLAQMALPVMASETEEVLETETAVQEMEETEIETVIETETEEIAEESEELKDEQLSGKCGDNMTYTFDTGTGVLEISGEGNMYNYSAWSSKKPAWTEYTVKTLIIKDGPESIGAWAFADCYSLSNISIPDSITSIGDYAFHDCSMSGINLPANLTYIGYAVFSVCKSLSSIKIPKGVTSIGERAFEKCSSLSSIELPEGVTSIGKDAFYDCSSLSSITLPESLTSIGDYAFYDCSNLTSIIIPEGSIDKLKSLVLGSGIYEDNGNFYTNSGSLITVYEIHPLNKCTIASIGTQTYTGSALTPELVIKYNSDVLKENKDYTVKYKNNKVPGLATVEITGIGEYKGTVTKSFYIRPKAAAVSSISNASTGMILKWKKVSYADGYYVYRGSEKIKTITSGDTLSYVDRAANTNGTKYTYKVYAYTKASNGKIVKAEASASKSYYRLERPAVSSLTNSAAGKMLVKWGKNSKVTGYQIQYSLNKDFSSAKAVAVSGNTNISKTITGLTKGKTYYVRVRSYKTVSGVKYYSAFSGAKYVKITR